MTQKHANLAAALAAFQADVPDIKKGSTNTHFKNSYADLPDIVKVTLPLLAKQGLAWTCRPTLKDGDFVLSYSLMHADSGESLDGDYPLPDRTAKAQDLGSAITYAKRYVFSAVVFIAPDVDDDGNDASNAPAQQRQQRPVQQRKPEYLPAGLYDLSNLTDVDHVRELFGRAKSAGHLSMLVQVEGPGEGEKRDLALGQYLTDVGTALAAAAEPAVETGNGDA